MRAIWQGEVLADSDATRRVDGYDYFPRDAVRMALLETTPRTADDLDCPHGVQFFDVVVGDERGARLAWSYEAPRGAMEAVEGWVGFWGEVEIA